MKIEIGQRFIWEEVFDGIAGIYRGEIIQIDDNTITTSWIDSKQIPVRSIQYDISNFLKLLSESNPRLKIDKEYYRDKALKELGI
jgi:hypothetical protein